MPFLIYALRQETAKQKMILLSETGGEKYGRRNHHEPEGFHIVQLER
jgi:hypothetical protein